MALPNNAVICYGQINQLLEKIKQGQAPEKFTLQHLKDIGFKSSNNRSFLPMLKMLGFLSEDGAPTKRYHDYRNNALSEKLLGQALKEAYSEIFMINEKPSENDKELIKGKFKSTHNTSELNAERMMKTFFALLELANIDDELIKKKKEEIKTKVPVKPKTQAPINEKNVTPPKIITSPSLNYNIQIHLPATKDVEVYNSIFKSLKEHLID